jgi:hypothetical protein
MHATANGLISAANVISGCCRPFPIQHRLDNVGRQQDQAKDAADVGPIDLLDGGDFRVGCVRVQLLSLAERCPGVGLSDACYRRVLQWPAVLRISEVPLLTQSAERTRHWLLLPNSKWTRMGRYKDYREPKRRGYDDDYAPRIE